MTPHYRDWNYKGSDRVALAATKLYGARSQPCRLAPLVLMTDPVRLSDPTSNAKTIPKGAAIIYRHYGADTRREIAERLRQITFSRGQQLLIGHDPALAIDCGADGVHFRRDAHLKLPAIWRRRCPNWIITMAGLKRGHAYLGELANLDALFVSSIFPSRSASAGAPIGINRLTSTCAALPVPVIALGGINAETAPLLIGSGAAGLAGISGI